MARAIWNGAVIAESDDIVVVEGNSYFPRESVNDEYVKDSDMHSACPWKGKASYLTLDVNGDQNEDAAWFYPDPKPLAMPIKGRVAFWRGVTVES